MISLTSLLILIVVGIVAGWLAGLIWKGGGFGLLGNLVIGVVGAFIGFFLFRFAGISYHGILGSIVVALVGALLLLVVINLIKRRS